MRRAFSLVLLLAFIASGAPLPLVAEEVGTTPPLSDPAGEPVLEENAGTKFEQKTGTTSELAIEEPGAHLEDTAEEDASEEAPVIFEALAAEPLPLSPSEQYLLNQDDAGSGIVFSGASGGSEHNLTPLPEYTAFASGPMSKVRIYLARNANDEGLPGGRTWSLTALKLDGGTFCTLVLGMEGHPVTVLRENFARIPQGAESDVELVEFTEGLGDCNFVEGDTYQFQLQYRVNGDPRWTNGIIYTKGADGVSEFFLQVIGPGSSAPVCIEDCYSNVLFLPGVKGSVLRDGTNPANKLWPPTVWSSDVRALALTDEGESVNSVVVDGILTDFYGTPVYGPFGSFMDSLVESKTINEWLSVPYDWRFSPEEILEDGVLTTSGTTYVLEEIEKLAARSRTGKVTIVAHSMGGLMAKAVVKALENEGKTELIDSVVLAASPQLGTPQGAASLLHGDDESILGGFIVDATDVRAVGQNMLSAYNLMPSARYFDEVVDPVFVFDENASFTLPWRNYFGASSINTYSDYEDFVTNRDQFRIYPDPTDLLVPEVLRKDMISNARSFHNTFDDFVFPEDIYVVQIAGWGVQTLKGITYLSEEGQQAYQARFTREGDKTVVYPSAIASDADETYYFNIADYNETLSEDASHKDVLNVVPVQKLLESILRKQQTELGSYLSSGKPAIGGVGDQLLVSTHSPVLLSVRDNLGNFTGVNPNQTLGGFLSIEEEIPGSTFFVVGGDNYAFLPKGGSYTFTFQGTDTGRATIKKSVVTGDTTTTNATYTDIPVTLGTRGEFHVTTSSVDTFISLDANGDGQVDTVVAPDGYIAPPTLGELIAALKAKIESLEVKPKLKEKLLNKIAKLEKKIAKNRNQKAGQVAVRLQDQVVKKSEKGKISDADSEVILELLNQIEAAL